MSQSYTQTKPALGEATWWDAVQDRDASYDGAFVYAVRSTGIYCRPSCAARRPRREQVMFFATPQAASQAGFRPCRRCRPGEVDAQAALIRLACEYIERHCEDSPTLGDLSIHLAVSPYHLQRIFKRVMGVSPRQYAEACRLAQFKAHLKKGEMVTRALYDAGYGSSSRLYPGQLGMTPTEYRKGGKGMQIGYTVVKCKLGYVLVAATERGVCAVSLGDSIEMLESALAEEYPAAEIRRDGQSLSRWVGAILDYLEGQPTPLDLPLDVQATVFQRRVWEALRAIPYGSTRSYSEIAQSLGHPQAARAVARACATNPVSIVVPCHRVVRTDGGLGGYRWGLERKRALLAQEKAALKPKADTEEQEIDALRHPVS
jgi:AraC family transcriptional regulator of adaptative response/methylated-DNA-[protein]-cysteine methyltransferase